MAIENILAQIDSEIARLTQARALLGFARQCTHDIRPQSSEDVSQGQNQKKHFLSADARKRIADAQRKRWAAVRAKSKAKK
ncbi:MAG: hypothetical protein WDM87_18140 [Terracidiphilus sp.]